jgi:hypothetical protein
MCRTGPESLLCCGFLMHACIHDGMPKYAVSDASLLQVLVVHSGPDQQGRAAVRCAAPACTCHDALPNAVFLLAHCCCRYLSYIQDRPSKAAPLYAVLRDSAQAVLSVSPVINADHCRVTPETQEVSFAGVLIGISCLCIGFVASAVLCCCVQLYCGVPLHMHAVHCRVTAETQGVSCVGGLKGAVLFAERGLCCGVLFASGCAVLCCQ